MIAAAVAALVLALLAAVGLGRAYRVADRKVQRRDKKIASLHAEHAKQIRELTADHAAELTLTREACDRQTVKARHLLKQAQGYRDEVLRVSERNADLRDQLDFATGAVREPSLVEEITAWLGTQPTTDDREENR